MKKVKLLGLGLMTIAFVACNQGPSPKEIEITKCETPKYEVLFETSSISGTQDLYNTQDFKALLGKFMRDSQCFSFVQTPSQNTWKMEVTYKLITNATSQDFNIAKGQSEATLKSLVTLNLTQPKQSIKERAGGELKLSKEHFFGAGKESAISKTEIERLLTDNIVFIIDDLRNK